MRIIVCLVGSLFFLTGCTSEEVITNKTTEMKEDRGSDLLDYNLRVGQKQIDSAPDEELQEFVNIDSNITLVSYPNPDGSYCLESYFNGDDSFKRHYSSMTQQLGDGGCE